MAPAAWQRRYNTMATKERGMQVNGTYPALSDGVGGKKKPAGKKKKGKKKR